MSLVCFISRFIKCYCFTLKVSKSTWQKRCLQNTTFVNNTSIAHLAYWLTTLSGVKKLREQMRKYRFIFNPSFNTLKWLEVNFYFQYFPSWNITNVKRLPSSIISQLAIKLLDLDHVCSLPIISKITMDFLEGQTTNSAVSQLMVKSPLTS